MREPLDTRTTLRADADTVREALECGQGNAWAWDGWPDAFAALARLEQTIDGLRRERSSLVEAAERTEAAERNLDKQTASMAGALFREVRAREAAEAERDAALRERNEARRVASMLKHTETTALKAAEAERDAALAARRASDA